MDSRILIRKSFFTVLLTLSVLVTACDGSEELFTDPSADDPSELVSQSNARVQMTTSACGTAPISNVVQSSDLDAPTIMTTGQIVSGSSPAGSYKRVTYWDIALEAGYYHVVLESERFDRRDDLRLGLNLTVLNSNGATDGTQIISGNATEITAFRARSYGFIELEEARNVILQVTPEFQSEDYRLAIFESGSAVPSPFLTDCPTVNALSLEATESLILPGKSSWAEDRWYRVELDTSAYLLKTDATLSSGVEDDIEYSVIYVDQFGGLQIGHSVDQTDTDTVGIGRIQLSEPGPVWIRIQNNNINELNMEITLTPES